MSKDAIYDVPTVSGFWKAFNAFSRAKAKVDVAKQAKKDAVENLKLEWEDFLEKHKSSYQYPVTITLPTPPRPPNFSMIKYDGSNYFIEIFVFPGFRN